MINVIGVFSESLNALVPMFGGIFVAIWFITWIAALVRRV